MRNTITKTSFSCVRDGLTIRGFYFKPVNATEKLPIVVVSHGFMGTYKQMVPSARELAENGFCAFVYDFNGGGIGCHSDGKTQDMTVLTEVEDLKMVIAFAKSLPETDSDSVTLFGASQGGFVSAIVAAQSGIPVKNLVLFFPALCIPDDARAGKMLFAKFDPKNIPPIILKFPMKLGACYAKAVIEMDPYEEIKGYEGPVLIVHGTGDKIVNYSYSQRAEKIYSNAKLVTIENGSHGFKREHHKIAMDAVKEFLA